MNNLAMTLVAKARWLEFHADQIQTQSQGHLSELPAHLKQRAASIWWRILQQVHFKDPLDPSPHTWYLVTFQGVLPELAPTDEDHARWQQVVSQVPGETSNTGEHTPPVQETQLSAE
jgi:hypothetical protein